MEALARSLNGSPDKSITHSSSDNNNNDNQCNIKQNLRLQSLKSAFRFKLQFVGHQLRLCKVQCMLLFNQKVKLTVH